MKKALKAISLILVLVLFALMAIGSGSSSSEDKPADSSTSSAQNSTDDSAKETTEKKTNEIAYEITDQVFEIKDSSFGNEKRFNVIIEITNTGDAPLCLNGCVLDFEDNDGHLLHTYDFLSNVPDIVEPGENGYFYTNGSSEFNEGMSFDNGCNLVPTLKIEKATGNVKRHEVTDESLYNNDYGSVGIKGRIINESDEEISYLYVTTVFYDKDGKVLGISGTSVTDIAANSKASFDDSGIFLEEFTVDDVGSYQVYADEMYMQF